MQDYFCLIQSLIAYIESRTGNPPAAMEYQRDMGVSYTHLRQIFRDKTDVPLGRYVIERRVAYAAFELIHSSKKVLDIALSYGFTNPDTFTRAFKRVTGITPAAFRQARVPVGRIVLSSGIYGPGISDSKERLPLRSFLEDDMNQKTTTRSGDSCILYGVQKVEYSPKEATPFPACLRSVLNYMGQDIDYCYLMAASGAAFRLRWNPECWDGGNVDIMAIHEDPMESFVRSFQAAGKSWRFLHRDNNTSKQDFMDFIRNEINEGRPLIALGIIGPPEACIISGYRNRGQSLLGWNFFQENKEFAAGTEIDESAYFISDSWWENPSTMLLMAVGEDHETALPLSDLIQHAADVLEREKIGNYAGGSRAWQLWTDKLSDNDQFSDSLPLPRLFERLMCHNDALTMICEGRGYGYHFMEYVSGKLEEGGNTEAALLGRKAAGCFQGVFEIAETVWKMQQGLHGEKPARVLAQKETREKIVPLLKKAAALDAEALHHLKNMIPAIKA